MASPAATISTMRSVSTGTVVRRAGRAPGGSAAPRAGCVPGRSCRRAQGAGRRSRPRPRPPGRPTGGWRRRRPRSSSSNSRSRRTWSAWRSSLVTRATSRRSSSRAATASWSATDSRRISAPGHPLSEGAQHRCEPLVVGAALRHQADGLMSAAGAGRAGRAGRPAARRAPRGRRGTCVVRLRWRPAAGPAGRTEGVARRSSRRSEALAQGWLADVEVAGGRRQRLVLAEGVQQLEVAHVDIHKLTLDVRSKMRRGRMDQQVRTVR